MRFVTTMLNAAQIFEESKDIEEHLERTKINIVKLKMECINGWWYGFYTPSKGGSEMFVAQGTTYEEAVANCKERLNNTKHNFKLEFNKNETNTI